MLQIRLGKLHSFILNSLKDGSGKGCSGTGFSDRSRRWIVISKSVLAIAIFSLMAACSSSETDASENGNVNSTETQSSELLDAKKTGTKRSETKVVANSKLGTHMILGTGSVQGFYFPIGGVICRLLNRHKAMHRIRCSLESTAGSIYNLRELRKGHFDLVVSQSDWQYHAYHGTSTFSKDGANSDLRAVFALEADPLTLMVKHDSDVQSFDDLQDRTVSFGYSRSLQHRIVNDLLKVKGWSDENFKAVRRMSDPKQVTAVCDGNVEAILLLLSSLNDMLSKLPETCKLRAVPINTDDIDQVILNKPFYRKGTIPRAYLNSEKDVESFGLGATFVASASTSPKAIYHVVKEIVENFRDFQSLHPSLISLEKKELPYAGITAPLHPGAVRYYKEARLLK